MVQPRSSLIRHLPVLGAAAAGVLVALVAIAIPSATLERTVDGSGLAAVLPVAAPPLGVTARAVLALGGGATVAAVAWAALYLLFGAGGPLAPRVRQARSAPTVRRADAHPDAPPRWPLSATELPAPPPPAERELPADLDMPLAPFDPAAVLPVPHEPARVLEPLAPRLAPGERMELFALAPPSPPKPAPADAPPCINALLRRLEQGAQRRAGAR